MGEINFFPDDLEIKDQKIILRLDLNVPIKDKIIKDDTRITLCLPFINRLIEKKAKIIIISHLGRPKGINIPDLSLIPIYKYLKDALKTNVYFFRGTFDGETKEKFSHLKGGEIILIENIRFFKEENEDDQDFSKRLGQLGDIYINDAFSCSHRKQASVHSITKFVKKSYAGPLLKKEITAINLVIKNRKEPVTCIIGGSKISTKINVITNLLKKVNNIVIVGAMANNFFVHKNLKVGKSLIEKNTKETIANIYKKAEEHNCKIFLPEDCVVGTDFEGTGKNKNLDEIQENGFDLKLVTMTFDDIDNMKTWVSKDWAKSWKGKLPDEIKDSDGNVIEFSDENIEDLKAQLAMNTFNEMISFDQTELQRTVNDSIKEIAQEILKNENVLHDLEFIRMFSNKMDPNNAYLDIQSGSGGTEAQDWAEMLMRMYLKWGESKGFETEVIEVSPGEVAGIKSAAIKFNGDYAYGWLRTETGVHRLVRKSPFDSGSRRHTSFASVFISPEIDDSIEIDLNPADIRIDTYRASGAGGQHVNKTDSAVRLTHEPTGTVVQCQNDRSQHKNKENAFKQLKSKLYELELQKQKEEQQLLEESKSDIGWGSQIRSYVLDQSRIKDLRTNVETGNTQNVLDGDLDMFIKASLTQGI